MATAINSLVLYKTNKRYVPAIILRAYSDAVGTVVDNAAASDSSITYADLELIGQANVKLTNVPKETAVSGSDGSIAAGTNADTTIASMATGTWFVLT